MVYENFKNGYFGIKKTSREFSASPFDLTLEQTNNADAGRRLTGITHFANSVGAHERWARSHGMRSAVTSHLYTKFCLKLPENVTDGLVPNRIRKYCMQL